MEIEVIAKDLVVIEDTEDICGKGYIVEVIDEEKVEIEDKVVNK